MLSDCEVSLQDFGNEMSFNMQPAELGEIVGRRETDSADR